jgi:3-methyladenine DNA glycosylase/8-oxoguanine DNA glycosylase
VSSVQLTAGEVVLRAPRPFHFPDVVYSHGWRCLAPFRWDGGRGVLARMERVAGYAGRVEYLAHPEGVLVRAGAARAPLVLLAARARWMLGLEDDLSAFQLRYHAHCELGPVVRRGAGRMLRCPTVWEDVVKTLLSVNTTWRQTVAMTERLVRLCGPEHPAGYAFPTPAEVAAHSPAELARLCRLGYRASALHRIAVLAVSGTVDLEALRDAGLPDGEVEARLRALPGIGPYAAANVMNLLGRHDHLPVDSWFRRVVQRGWFGGAAVPDRHLVDAFEPHRPFRGLVYRCYPWPPAEQERAAEGDT